VKRIFNLLILILFPLIALGALFWYLHVRNLLPTDIDNQEAKALEFKDNTLQCPQCHMYLVGKNDTVQIITHEHKTHFFDDPGCAILWLKAQKIDPKEVTFWVFSKDTKRYIDAKKAHFSFIDTTPMMYGFGAYENDKEQTIDFEEMRLRMLRGETLQDPKIRQHLLKGH
jgi:hypothetical protein